MRRSNGCTSSAADDSRHLYASLPMWYPFERIQCGIDSFQTVANGFAGPAETQAKVLRLLEELAGYNTGVELLAQEHHEIAGAADAEAGKNRGAEAARFAVELRTAGEELVDQHAVGLEQTLRAIANVVEVVKRDDRDQLSRVDMASVGEVNDLPHPLDQLRFCENPTAPDTAKPVCLRQTAGNDEVRAKVKRRTPWLVEDGFEVNLVYQNPRSDQGGLLAGLAQSVFVGECAAGIVQVTENDEPCFRRDAALEFAEPEAKTFVRPTLETVHLRANVIENGEQRIVGGLLDQHFVTAIDQRGQRQVVSHRGAECVDDILLRDTGFLCQPLHERPVAVGAGAADLQILDPDRQLGEGVVDDAADSEVERRCRV